METVYLYGHLIPIWIFFSCPLAHLGGRDSTTVPDLRAPLQCPLLHALQLRPFEENVQYTVPLQVCPHRLCCRQDAGVRVCGAQAWMVLPQEIAGLDAV